MWKPQLGLQLIELFLCTKLIVCLQIFLQTTYFSKVGVLITFSDRSSFNKCHDLSIVVIANIMTLLL
jgi:hypothetical protein